MKATASDQAGQNVKALKAIKKFPLTVLNESTRVVKSRLIKTRFLQSTVLT